MADVSGVLTTPSQLQQQQADAAAKQKALQAEQTKLAQIQGQYLPKVGVLNAIDPITQKKIAMNPVYERPYREQFARTQGAYKEYSDVAGKYNVNVDAYNAQLGKYNQDIQAKNADAQAQIAKLNLTPKSQNDLDYAKSLYDKGYISQDDYSAYKNIAIQNINAQNTANLAKNAVAKLNITPTTQNDIIYAQSLADKGYISKEDFSNYKNIAQSNIDMQKPQQQYELVTGNMQVRRDPSAPLTGNWRQDYIWVQAGWRVKGSPFTDRNTIFATVPGLPDANKLSQSVRGQTVILDTSPYLQSEQLQKVAAKQDEINAKDAFLQSLENAAKAKSDAMKANFGGTVNASMLAPVGTITDVGKALSAGLITKQEASKIAYLQSPTAQYTSVKDFTKLSSEVHPVLGNLDKINVVDNSIFKTGQQQLDWMNAPKPILPSIGLRTKADLNEQLGLGVLNTVLPLGTKTLDDSLKNFPIVMQVPISTQKPTKSEPTPIEKATLFPLYEASQKITKEASDLGGKYIVPYAKYTPLASLIGQDNATSFSRGIVGGIASIPEMGATVGLGYEMIGRDIISGKSEQVKGMVALGIGISAKSMVTSAIEHPYETAGQIVGQSLFFEGLGKVPTSVKIPRIQLEEASGIRSLRETIPEISREPTSRQIALSDARALFGEYKTGFETKFLSEPTLRQISLVAGRERVGEIKAGIETSVKTELAKPTQRQIALTEAERLLGTYKTGLETELAKPTSREVALQAGKDVVSELDQALRSEFAKPSLQTLKVTAGREQIVEPLTEAFKEPSLQVEKVSVSKSTISEAEKIAKKELAKPTMRTESATAVEQLVSTELAKPTLRTEAMNALFGDLKLGEGTSAGRVKPEIKTEKPSVPPEKKPPIKISLAPEDVLFGLGKQEELVKTTVKEKVRGEIEQYTAKDILPEIPEMKLKGTVSQVSGKDIQEQLGGRTTTFVQVSPAGADPFKLNVITGQREFVVKKIPQATPHRIFGEEYGFYGAPSEAGKVVEYNPDVILKALESGAKESKSTKLPEIYGVNKKIIEVIKREGGTVGGSISQKTLYPDARPFHDVDVIAPNSPKVLAQKIVDALGENYKVEKGSIVSDNSF